MAAAARAAGRGLTRRSARRRVVLAALAGATLSCVAEGVDLRQLEARHPQLRALGPHPLGETKPYALALAGELTLFLCRWPDGAPIPVSFAGEPDTAQREALASALRAWERAGLGVRFASGGAAAAGLAGIRVRLRDDLVTSQANTVADCAVDGAGAGRDGLLPGARLVSASIHAASADPHLRLTLLHELGHALGFQGHAPRGGTLMLASASELLERARRIGETGPLEDTALRALYAVPSGAVLARVALAPAQTRPADRLQALATARGLAGPFVRAGDPGALVFWMDRAGRRWSLRVEGVLGALRRPGGLRLQAASAEAQRALEAPAGTPPGAVEGPG